MDSAHFLAALRDSLLAINHPRLFESERGYQGELLTQMSSRIKLPPHALAEQEYQKKQQIHGLKIRPDIVIHEPFDERRHTRRDEGNFAVIELKLKASRKSALGDFASLTKMMQVLRYPLGVFVNIGSKRTFGAAVPAEAKGSIVCFAVTLDDGKVTLYEEGT